MTPWNELESILLNTQVCGQSHGSDTDQGVLGDVLHDKNNKIVTERVVCEVGSYQSSTLYIDIIQVVDMRPTQVDYGERKENGRQESLFGCWQGAEHQAEVRSMAEGCEGFWPIPKNQHHSQWPHRKRQRPHSHKSPHCQDLQ